MYKCRSNIDFPFFFIGTSTVRQMVPSWWYYLRTRCGPILPPQIHHLVVRELDFGKREWTKRFEAPLCAYVCFNGICVSRSLSLNVYFREIYGKPQILEVQLAYDFSKLKAAQRKVLAAQIGRQHCEEILQKTGQRPLTTVSTNKLSPCCQCCGASHVDGIEYFTEEEEAGKTEASEHRHKLKSLGIAFVTFQDPKVVERYARKFGKDWEREHIAVIQIMKMSPKQGSELSLSKQISCF